MFIKVDPADERPLYRQVADEIKTLIAAGKLKAGDPLPAVRQVALDLGVNLNTIATTYLYVAWWLGLGLLLGLLMEHT